ncbi:MAG: DUF4446 family protein [Candidatus Moranbacteria bacterium]|jgi:hypothetical protein|nr:DUF4446 family protein [Candidatus Moranbacteria bacterium]
MLEQNIELALYVLGSGILLLLIWNMVLQWNLMKIKKNQTILFSGKTGKSLEDILLKNNLEIRKLSEEINSLRKTAARIQDLADTGLHKTGIVRFNPFRDIGGDQSFSLSLLDGRNNGLVISSLYSRDGVRVYAKSILNGQSLKYPLTQEEKFAIAIASKEKNNQKNKKNL